MTAGPNMSLLRPIDLARLEIIFAVYCFGSFPDDAILDQQPQPCFVRALRTILSISGVQLETKRRCRLPVAFSILATTAGGFSTLGGCRVEFREVEGELLTGASREGVERKKP